MHAATLPQRTAVAPVSNAAGSVTTAQSLRTESAALSLMGEPFHLLPEDPVVIVSYLSALPGLIAEASGELRPMSADRVHELLLALANHLAVPIPPGEAFDIQVEILAAWPEDLFLRAYRRVFETFPASYRRLPACSDFHVHVADDLAERRGRHSALQDFRMRLEARTRLRPGASVHGCSDPRTDRTPTNPERGRDDPPAAVPPRNLRRGPDGASPGENAEGRWGASRRDGVAQGDVGAAR